MFLKDVEKKLLEKKDYREAKEKLLSDSLYCAGKMIYEARLNNGLTQEALAKKLKTKQPVIASIENGNRNISLKYLEKIAKALEMKMIPPKFESIKTIANNFTRNLFVATVSNDTIFHSANNIETNINHKNTAICNILVTNKTQYSD